MTIIEHGNVPAGWYPDESTEERLRWWDGGAWTNEVRPLVIAIVPDFVTARPEGRPVVPLFAPPAMPPVASTYQLPSVRSHETLSTAALAPVHDITDRLASAPERQAPASTSEGQTVPLTRRQLRERGALASGVGHSVDPFAVATLTRD